MPKNQGEGDHESAEHYNKDQKEFVESGKVEQERADLSEREKQELEKAEEAGKSRAKD